MVGNFVGRYLGAEAVKRKDGTVKYQAAFLFGKKSENVNIEEIELFTEVSKLAEFTGVTAVIDVVQKNWDGKSYVNYELKEFYTDVAKSESSEQNKKQTKQAQDVR